jgi:hypothetical protein
MPAVAQKTPKTPPQARALGNGYVFAAVLGAALLVLFYQGLKPGMALFANDGSLGAMSTAANRLPGRFTGTWNCQSFLGIEAPAAAPSLTMILSTLLSPAIYLKIYGPLSLFFVGFCAWVFFRQLEFNAMVCIAAGVATGLNMHFFSTACWGLGTWNVSAGMIFLALAAICTRSIRQAWARAVLAGFAVGLSLMEGFDSGGILSIFVGLFILFREWNQPSPVVKRGITAVAMAATVVLFSLWIGADTLSSLFETQIKDAARTSASTPESKRWDFSTQWSLPKTESLRLIAPGLFGYRLAQFITTEDKSSLYWGLVGQDPRIAEMSSSDPKVREFALNGLHVTDEELRGVMSDDPSLHKGAVDSVRTRFYLRARHTGTGEYAGIMVALLAVFAVANSFRRESSPFSLFERKTVWFWAASALFALLAAWGRHGFIYRILFHLPFFSSIRNPIKFLHAFHLAWIILAAFGLEALHRRYLKTATKGNDFVFGRVKSLFTKAAGFDKKWAVGCAVACGIAIIALLAMVQFKEHLLTYLQDEGFTAEISPRIAAFSISEVAWSVAFLLISVWIILGIVSGAWSGAQEKWAWIYLIGILILDLGRSDKPWIMYFNYKEKYQSNTVLDFLAQNPEEHRVIGRLSPLGPYNISGDNFNLLYHYWLQNDFPYHNIQALDVAQWPRMPLVDSNYLGNFICTGTNASTANLEPAVRLFQLTNTRFILANATTGPLLNERGDPAHKPFQTRARLSMQPRPGVGRPEDLGDYTVEPDDSGKFAVVEYTQTLPRAKLFSDWKSGGDGPATLKTLASPEFDPFQTVLIAAETPAPQTAPNPAADPGTVNITEYKPKYVQLTATAKSPAILLLNDHYATDWKCTIDQKPAPILRCNYIMRGVFLPPGEHKVEFRFQPSLTGLYVTLAAWVAALAVTGFVVSTNRPRG